MLAGTAQMVVGERPIESIDDFSRTKKLLQRAGTAVVRRFSGTNVRDAASGFRAYSRDAGDARAGLRSVHVHDGDDHPGGVERCDRRVGADRGQPEDARVATGEERAAYIVRSASTIVRSFALYKPFRFFFAIGAVPFFVGVALLIRWLLSVRVRG